jgi:hypothetical protein
MPLPAPVVASIVSAVIEAAVQSSQPADASPARYGEYAAKRVLPPEARIGFMQPPPGNGTITIDDKVLPLSPVARFRSEKNLIVVPMSVQASNVVYVNDNFGNVYRVWMISQAVADSLRNNSSQ